MTQLKAAKNGKITPEMKLIASKESLTPEYIRDGIARGKIVIVKNKLRNTVLSGLGILDGKKFEPMGIGKGLRTKVNANIGTSSDSGNLIGERKKLKIAVRAGADAIMDLSIGKNLVKVRKMGLSDCPVPFGTVPIYQLAVETVEKGGDIKNMYIEDIFRIIEDQAKAGVDFMTLHCGVNKDVLKILKKNERLMGIVSRGGTFLANWMFFNKKENPLYEGFDKILKIAQKYDITISLGDGLRPGCLKDSLDAAQLAELSVLGELARRAWKANVQVMIEGPGHVPLDQVKANVLLEKTICHGAPFYVLGPLVTDIAPGYDHITAAIGGAIAASAGADFLCYVTPSEHLSLPDEADVEEGVMASRIAAHAADIVKGVKKSIEWDIEMAKARKSLDWKMQEKLSINPKIFKEKVKYDTQKSAIKGNKREEKVCTMCGKFCALKLQ